MTRIEKSLQRMSQHLAATAGKYDRLQDPYADLPLVDQRRRSLTEEDDRDRIVNAAVAQFRVQNLDITIPHLQELQWVEKAGNSDERWFVWRSRTCSPDNPDPPFPDVLVKFYPEQGHQDYDVFYNGLPAVPRPGNMLDLVRLTGEDKA